MTTVYVSKAVIEKDAKFLLIKRSPQSPRWPEHWDFLGGRLEPDETPADALVREVKEETGLLATPKKDLGAFEHENTQHDELIVFHLFDTAVRLNDVTLSHEHTDYRWFTREEMSQLKLQPSVKLYLSRK